VDVLRRTRRNADTIRGAAPDVTIGRPAAVRAGARPYHCIGIAKHAGKMIAPFAPIEALPGENATGLS